MANDVVRFGVEFDSRRMVTGLNAGDRKLRQVERSAGRASGAMKLMAAAAAAAFSAIAIRRIADMGVELFKLGAAANATANRFRVVFGESTKQVNEFAREFQKIGGLSRRQFEDLTARAGAITQGMGAAQDASAQFAEQILRLGADLASFNDLPVPAAIDAIVAAMAGENEKIKRFNIILREQNVVRQALVDTGKKQEIQLTELERGQAKLNEITRQAGVALGDLERTSQDVDNVVKQLTAAWRDFQDRLGSFIAQAPVVREFLTRLRDGLQSVNTILQGEAAQIKAGFGQLGIIAGNAFLIALGETLTRIPDLFVPFGLEDKLPGFKVRDKAFDALFAAARDNIRDAANELDRLANLVGAAQQNAAGLAAEFEKLQIVGLSPTGVPIFAPRAGATRAKIIPPAPPAVAGGGIVEPGRFFNQIDFRLTDPRRRAAIGLPAYPGLPLPPPIPTPAGTPQTPQVAREFLGPEGVDFFVNAKDGITDLDRLATAGFVNMSSLLTDFIGTGVEGIGELTDAFLRMFQRLAAEAAFRSLGTALGVPGFFQTGGIVPGPIGKPQLAVVHGGEEITPFQKTPAGDTFNLTNQFTIQAIDTQSGMQFVKQYAATISEDVVRQIERSLSLRRRLN